MQNSEEMVLTPTMKKLREMKAKNVNFYLPAIKYSDLVKIASFGSSLLLVYSAIRITINMRGQWATIPTKLQDQIPLTRPRLSRAIKRLEQEGHIQVRREPGKKLRFILTEPEI